MSQAEQASSLTPLMRQYYAVKAQHPDKILFFRMGDFYEMFGDDAVKAAPLLGIALTSRSHGTTDRIPLAGVPYHAVDRYLARLINKGEKVVIVEQVEDPKTAKGIVKRDIVEIVTPGTAMVDSAEDMAGGGTLAAIHLPSQKTMGFAYLELSTGSFMIDEGPLEEMIERLRILEPNEILISTSEDIEQTKKQLGALAERTSITPFEEWHFDLGHARRELNQQFGTTTLESFGVDTCTTALVAAGAVFRYLKENRRDQLTHLTRLVRLDQSEFMPLDYSTVRNLELVRNSRTNTEEHSLYAVINHCHTTAGARRLRASLLRPFRAKDRIELRLGAVAELVKNRDLAFQIRERTKFLPDLEKLTARLGVGKLNPRQISNIRDALVLADQLRAILVAAHSPLLQRMRASLPTSHDLIELINRALVEEPPLSAAKGGMFREGYSPRLDELNASIKDARVYIASLQQSERQRTGIATLKVGFNQVFGYYLEVTAANASLVPKEYIRKQTLVNAERYITPELKEREELILAAEEKINRLELELYEELLATLTQSMAMLVCTGDLLAELDLVASLAELAIQRGYVRPEIYLDTRLTIISGRHPVIESVLPRGAFVSNDIALDRSATRMMILTGPNMSGKSTYLRQIGHIVILAQIGSFVPADKAEIGLVDRVFTRVGALDNLTQGQSTFLVEMVETANILHNATERSLILLDEVGRGTSTFDGLSVAWSVVEYIDETKKARTVFATHYHELTGMAELSPTIHNYQVAVKKWEDRVVFLHKIIPGGCDDSYGIEVAKLAGLPRHTISRARQILKLLESGKFTQSELGKGVYKAKVQPTLFDQKPSEIENQLRELNLDTLTPVQAFDLLRHLKDELDRS